MPLQKVSLKPGINREGTRYSTEGGYYDGDKIRFRQGLPEKIGGWLRISETTFEGVARSLHNWVTLGNQNLIGVGTHLKFYIENVGNYNDIHNWPLARQVCANGGVKVYGANRQDH